MSWDDASPTQYLGPVGYDVLLPNGKVIRMSETHAKIAESEHGAKVLGVSTLETGETLAPIKTKWDDENVLTVVPRVEDNPYDSGLAALLYAHGAVAEAEAMNRKLEASGGVVPEGGFPTRCTTCDDRGVRCYLEYAHKGGCDFGSGPMENIAGVLTTLPVKRGGIKYGEVKFMPEKQPHARILSEDTAIHFLNRKVENIHEQIEYIDTKLAEMEAQKVRYERERTKLRSEENHVHEAIATLTAVKAKKLGEGGEGHGGSR